MISAELVSGLLLSCWLAELEARLATLPAVMSSAQLLDGAELASASDAASAGQLLCEERCHVGELIDAAALAVGETQAVGDIIGGEATSEPWPWKTDIAATEAFRCVESRTCGRPSGQPAARLGSGARAALAA
jgi:hypothetical protein